MKMKNIKKINIIYLVFALVILFITPIYSKVEAAEVKPGVKYLSHVQDYGWEKKYVQDGQQSGTTGQNKKVEAMKIELVNNTSNIKINYALYVQGQGWQKTMSNGQEAGTTGRNLRMEAIKIWLEGTSSYSVTYRTHIQDFGWQDWVYDGQISGNLGDEKKIEAIEIKIIEKQSSKFSVSYCSHVQDIGWQNNKEEYDISGTTGQNKKIEAVKINLVNAPSGVGIRYRTYVDRSGWQDWVSNGKEAGTTGKNLRAFALRIELTGTKDYTVKYRAHIQDIGWGPWKTNGEMVGEIANEKKIEAIQVQIIKTKNTKSSALGVEYYSYLEGVAANENRIEADGDLSGTTGQNRKLEALNIELVNAPANAHIKYQAHVQDIGWMDWVKDGKLAGVLNRGLKVEAIKIELENLPDYTVEYTAHVQDIGWTEKYIDGEVAGTTGQNKKIEAVTIKIVPKYKRYFQGIDVSYWQGSIDFNKLSANPNLDFMITRIGWYRESQSKLVVDTQFETNYKQARAKKIPLGAYFYSYATTVEGAKKEAEAVVKYLKESGCTTYELPIFYDIEDGTQRDLGKDINTQMSIAFCEVLKKAGFKVGVYSYSYWLTNYMDISKLPNDYSLWVANYGKNNDGRLPDDIYRFAQTHDIWQYTSSGHIDGVNGEVDMNICYKRYF